MDVAATEPVNAAEYTSSDADRSVSYEKWYAETAGYSVWADDHGGRRTEKKK